MRDAAAGAVRIVEPMAAYVRARPGLKYIFYGGKGGVGKTVLAAATALWSAHTSRRTLLVSTNPVHSLSTLLEQDVFGRHAPVTGVPNLFAYEIDPQDAIERSRGEIREKIQWFLKYAEISTRANDFVDASTLNPAFEESAMFEKMIELMAAGEYDAYIFDTAPAANARRLLGMSKVYALWVDRLIESRREAQGIRQRLSFTKKREPDPLMEYLAGLQQRMAGARELLTDEQQTAFFFVTLPEALPIAVVGRFMGWFQDLGIPIGGVLVNMHIDPCEAGEEPVEFVRNRLAAQDAHMETIWAKFGGRVRAVLPLLDTDVQGVAMLRRLAENLFAPEGSPLRFSPDGAGSACSGPDGGE